MKRAPLPAVLEWETQLGVINARIRGQALWAVRYTDGRIIHQWDKDPGAPYGRVDWPRIPYRGRQMIRLYCPDGQFAHLGSNGEDNTGRIFQIGGAVSVMGLGKGQLYQLIGVIYGLNGECACYTWEYLPDGSGRLRYFEDNVYAMRYHHVGALNADVLGIDDGEGR